MAGELFKSMADINAVHVPYKGSSGARTDIIGGQVDLMFDAVTTMTEQVRGGKVKALATTGLKRSDVKATWTKQGAAPMVMNPTVFDKYMRDDITKWAGVIKKANIKLD
jgi:tripartite-type tricarboxylate transporter receptor subunit TctC